MNIFQNNSLIMSSDDQGEKIKDLEDKVSELERKEQDVKINKLTQRMNYLQEKISEDNIDNLDDNMFNNSTSNSPPPTFEIDNKVREILGPSEKPVQLVRYRGKIFGGQYEKILITNKRLIFFKITGMFSKKLKYDQVRLRGLGFPTMEEKGWFSKKAIMKWDIGMGEPIKWEGNPSEIQGLNQQILGVIRG